MATVRRTRLMEMLWSAHARVFKATKGRVGSKAQGMPILMLTTTGRRSGEPRERALMHFADGENLIVIASNAGEPKHPAWYLNLEANPEVKVLLRGSERPMRARTAEGAEREELWRKLIEINADYDTYQQQAGDREIPVVVLEPVAES